MNKNAVHEVLWSCGDRVNGYQPGSFVEALLEAWVRADMVNQAKLASVFPEYAEPIAIVNLRGVAGLAEMVSQP